MNFCSMITYCRREINFRIKRFSTYKASPGSDGYVASHAAEICHKAMRTSGLDWNKVLQAQHTVVQPPLAGPPSQEECLP